MLGLGEERRNWTRQDCESCCCQHDTELCPGSEVLLVPKLCRTKGQLRFQGSVRLHPLLFHKLEYEQTGRQPWQHRCQLLLGASEGSGLQAASSADLELQTGFHLVYCYLSLLSCSDQKGRCLREKSKLFHPKVM